MCLAAREGRVDSRGPLQAQGDKRLLHGKPQPAMLPITASVRPDSMMVAGHRMVRAACAMEVSGPLQHLQHKVGLLRSALHRRYNQMVLQGVLLVAAMKVDETILIIAMKVGSRTALGMRHRMPIGMGSETVDATRLERMHDIGQRILEALVV